MDYLISKLLQANQSKLSASLKSDFNVVYATVRVMLLQDNAAAKATPSVTSEPANIVKALQDAAPDRRIFYVDAKTGAVNEFVHDSLATFQSISAGFANVTEFMKNVSKL